MRSAAILAIVALSLGIGATTTMFSVVDATLWRPMPLERSDRLAVVSVTKTTARDGLQRLRWSRRNRGTRSRDDVVRIDRVGDAHQHHDPDSSSTRHRTRHGTEHSAPAPSTQHAAPSTPPTHPTPDTSTQHSAPAPSTQTTRSSESGRRNRLPAVAQDAAHRDSGRAPVSS
jgi:hypothetical protein